VNALDLKIPPHIENALREDRPHPRPDPCSWVSDSPEKPFSEQICAMPGRTVVSSVASPSSASWLD
jgi:hypothetical protein